MVESVVLQRFTTNDVTSGRARLPFTSRSAWLDIQSECPDVRRTLSHLTQGTRSSKNITNAKDVKRYLNVASIARDGLLVVRRNDPLSPARDCIIVPRMVLDGLVTTLHIQLDHPSFYQLKQAALITSLIAVEQYTEYASFVSFVIFILFTLTTLFRLSDQNNNQLAKKFAGENVEAFADVCGNLAGSRWKRKTGCRSTMAGAEKVVKSGLSSALSVFFEYDTPKIVHISSKTVGVINRLIQLVILAYLIGYVIVWKKGYQEFDQVESAVTTKVKGVVYTNFTHPSIPGISSRLWDVPDYVIPPQENAAFFVMTNMIFTPNQTQGKCEEDPSMQRVNCTSDADCHEGESVLNGNGVRTGKCINSTRKPGQKVCEIYAWCPVENDTLPLKNKALLEGSKDFTVLIKNQIEFPKFGKKKRNILETQNKEYLRSCRYNSSDPDDRLCPIFQLGTITDGAGEKYDEMAIQGGIVAINILWNCNLDYAFEYCKPQYTFRRLDDSQARIAKGWNFRYANYYYENGVQKRDLIKAYGILFVLKVAGEAGKFSVVPLLLNVGSGLGLLAIATVLCDIVVLYLLKRGTFYKEKKYLYVKGDDAFTGFDNSGSLESSQTQHLAVATSPASYQSFAESPMQDQQIDEHPRVTNRRTGNSGERQRAATVGEYSRMDEEVGE
ncbi:P2X purinoceptor 4 [Lamellibrachia satsuma]|nr:P2X purinoceptor 4 [Lamellibrachia satsuma]